MTIQTFIRFTLIATLGFLGACHPNPGPSGQLKIGKPYEVNGQTYYPQYEADYDKTGLASWYGPGFHGKYTASGEVFNQNDLTAAHPTLPMPSLVRVTNLQTGQSLIVRINDRGPFKSNRIIDLSKAAAMRIGVRSTQEVRVQFLKKESETYLASVQNGHPMDIAELNDSPEVIAPQIVESTVALSHTGSAVADAAPVMSVSSSDTDVIPAANAHETTPAPLVPAAQPIEETSEIAISDTPAKPVELWADNAPPPAPEIAPPAKNTIAPKAAKAMAADAAAPSTGGNYIIQAGSFASKENARKLVSKLQPLGKAFSEKADADGKSWWRVRVGPFADRATAETVLDKVRDAGVPDAHITHL